ncbi:hypothetical protein FRC07_002990 [Ceratobasidium sp. 392]|nr:hypothetical protein FRC07_002990 [Ceratobasidium sp. 392]
MHCMRPKDILVAMKYIATDSERVAQEMERRFEDTENIYFRFSVDQGMQEIELNDWTRLDEVLAHTQAYMRQRETDHKMDRAVKSVNNRECTIRMRHMDGRIYASMTQEARAIKMCPAPSSFFTGQMDIIRRVEKCITHGDKERCIFVLHGIGGAGKTQIVLKMTEQTHGMWSDIVYVDVTSRETADSALAAFAKAKGVGRTYSDTIRWLGTRHERWLMVLDNADDPSLNVSEYFPPGNHGSIVITTRRPDVAELGQGLRTDSCGVSSMDPKEALELLLQSAQLKEDTMSDKEMGAAGKLLENFGHLALAIVQAGAYIWRSQSTILDYHELLLRKWYATLDKPPANRGDCHQDVYTAWRLSYDRLNSRAQQLLGLMAFMDRSSITEDIFKWAATNIQKYSPLVPFSEEEASIQLHIQQCLLSYLDLNGAWDSNAFQADMIELRMYSLIDYDRVNNAYTIHILVHHWISTVVACSRTIAVRQTMFLLAVSVDSDDAPEKLRYKRALEVHVNWVLQQDVEPSGNNASHFSEVYACVDRWDQKEPLDIVTLAASGRALGDEHLITLKYKICLALTYESRGKYEQAENAILQALNVMKRVLGAKDPNTLSSMEELASVYTSWGRHKLADELNYQVLAARKSIFGEDAPDTLRSLSNLGATSERLGRIKLAESLHLQVLDTTRNKLGNEHHKTLTSMKTLAGFYHRQDQLEQAESLWLQILSASQKEFGYKHPNTLEVMRHLGLTYHALGQHQRAEELAREVINGRKLVLGDEHLDTIDALYDLAHIYQSQGLFDKAEPLLLKVLDTDRHVLSDQHPNTLVALRDLATTYRDCGQFERAVELLLQVVDTSKQALGHEHPDTLRAMCILGMLYRDLKQYEKAERLLLHLQ